MKKTTKQTIGILLLTLLICLSDNLFSQNVIKDKAGNYTAIRTTKDSAKATPTGKTFTDLKGNVYPVMLSERGKLFVRRVTKEGRQYNQYLREK